MGNFFVLRNRRQKMPVDGWGAPTNAPVVSGWGVPRQEPLPSSGPALPPGWEQKVDANGTTYYEVSGVHVW